jgi:putative addiction module component (TIGR02574 family)
MLSIGATIIPMNEEVSELLKKALALPLEARAALAGSLLDSLDATVDADGEALWENEIARRIEELDTGKAKTVPWAEVRRRIAAKMSHGV